MSITYTFKIKQLNTIDLENYSDVISHIHFDYIGTDENNISGFCQGVLPLQIIEHVFTMPDGETKTIPSILEDDGDFIAYNDITENDIISWINTHLPKDVLQTYQSLITEQINNKYNSKNYLPWEIE